MSEISSMSLLLPEGILEFFDLVKIEKLEKSYSLFLEENNVIKETPKDPNDFMLNIKDNNQNQQGKLQKKIYTPINSYRPSGNLVYNDDLLIKIEDKFN